MHDPGAVQLDNRSVADQQLLDHSTGHCSNRPGKHLPGVRRSNRLVAGKGCWRRRCNGH